MSVDRWLLLAATSTAIAALIWTGTAAPFASADTPRPGPPAVGTSPLAATSSLAATSPSTTSGGTTAGHATTGEPAPTPGVPPPSPALVLPNIAPTVGALFDNGGNGGHFCTASVVGTRRKSVLITAAHCVHDGHGGGQRQNIAFVPAYHDGQRPYGTWTVTGVLVDDAWSHDMNPDADVAILTVADADGVPLADVVGANALGAADAITGIVDVFGYPDDRERPRQCTTEVEQQSHHQLRFRCADFTTGTSGGPWLADYDPARGTGEVIGVIGGYQQGGDTADVSFSPQLDETVQRLYDAAG